MNPFVALALNFGPLAVFFTTFKVTGDLFSATAALMVATTISIAVHYALTKKIPISPLVTGAMVLVFGGLTLWLNSEFFIKVKLTIIEALMGSAFLIGYLLGRPIAKDMMGVAFELPDWCWRILTLRWAGFFFFIAAANEIARNTLATPDWVDFKVWGVTALGILFQALNTPLMMKNEIKAQTTTANAGEQKS